MSSAQKILVVLPTYNEIENLPEFVPAVLSALKTDVLIIDDHSPDGTGELAEKMAREHAAIHVLHRPKKLGLGSAYVKGFQWALERRYDVIVQMDSDFSHAPGDVPNLVAALSEADFAIGSRYLKEGSIQNWPKWRLWVSEMGNAYARSVLNLETRDLTGGFKAWKRKVLEAIDLKKILSDGYAFQAETTFRAGQKGFKSVEIPIVFKDRTQGRSKISRKILLEAMWVMWKLRLSGRS